MSNILDKYKAARPILRTGDIILFRGTDLIDKAIQMADKAYFNHIGIIWQAEERFLICDATGGRGVNIDFLSTRMKQETDFCVLRVMKPTFKIEWALQKALLLGDEGYGYNYLFILQIALKNLFGWDFKRLSNKNSFICSKFVQYYTDLLDIEEYRNLPLATPQDYIRKIGPNVSVEIR